MLELKHKAGLLSRIVLFMAVMFGFSFLLPAALNTAPSVYAQSSRQTLCQNGRLIIWVPSVTGTSCQDRFGVPPVSDEVFYRCNDFPTDAERLNCINDPALNDGTGAPVTSAGEDIDADCLSLNRCGIINFVIMIINVLSGIVGVVIVIMIVIGGIQYTTARDNPQGVAAARERIINALLALVFYLAMTAFLQWIVPGGVFSG